MNRRPEMKKYTIFFVFVLLTSTGAYANNIRGMAFSTGHDLWGYRQPYTDKSLSDLKKTGANYVHISAYTKMNSIKSLNATQETDASSIKYIIKKCKSKGFKVFFKPVVEIKKNKWRGFLKGSSVWFNKVYSPFILKMAKIAQAEKVELFSVGSEYAGTLKNTKEWVKIIKKVRAVYKGKLTYVGNHDSYKNVKFWNRLDYISISGYFKLLPGVRGPSPGMEETKKLWLQKAKQIGQWRTSNGYMNKKVLIAEIGAQSKGKGVVYRVPWDWLVKAPVDKYEQVKMYEGILNAFMKKSWCTGVILWNWELDPNAGLTFPSTLWYTPQNKPALKVMKKYFKGRKN